MKPDQLPTPSAADLKVPSTNSNKAPEAGPVLAVKTPSDKEVFASLAAMRPAEYDRVRKEHAKELGIQVKTLDDEVKIARMGNGIANDLPFNEIEPHSEPVDPAQVLD